MRCGREEQSALRSAVAQCPTAGHSGGAPEPRAPRRHQHCHHGPAARGASNFATPRGCPRSRSPHSLLQTSPPLDPPPLPSPSPRVSLSLALRLGQRWLWGPRAPLPSASLTPSRPSSTQFEGSFVLSVEQYGVMRSLNVSVTVRSPALAAIAQQEPLCEGTRARRGPPLAGRLRGPSLLARWMAASG